MEITPELAELFGAYVGDGTMSINKGGRSKLLSIAANKDEKGWLNYIAHLFEQVFYHRPKVRLNKDVYKIQTGVNKICKFFTEVGLPTGEKVLTIRVPKIIMETVDSTISKAFLRGYFDADGCLLFERARLNGRCVKFKKTHHYYPRIVLCSVSKDLIVVDIKYMLKSAGLCYNICKVAPSGKGKHEGYFVTINGATQVGLWMREIGSSNPIHRSKYHVWKKFGFCPPRTTLEQRKLMLSGELDPEIFYSN